MSRPIQLIVSEQQKIVKVYLKYFLTLAKTSPIKQNKSFAKKVKHLITNFYDLDMFGNYFLNF